jgi:Zn-dependent M16 (insulinase) family peptidase
MEVFLNMMYDPLFRKDDFKEIVWRYLLKDENKLEIDGDTANELKNMSNYSEIKIFDAIQKELLEDKALANLEISVKSLMMIS